MLDENARRLLVELARQASSKTFTPFLPEPQASLLTGILLGDDVGIPKSVQDAFRATGPSHVIAISG